METKYYCCETPGDWLLADVRSDCVLFLMKDVEWDTYASVFLTHEQTRLLAAQLLGDKILSGKGTENE